MFYLTSKSTKAKQHHQIRFAIYKRSKHGQTCLVIPQKSYVLDLIICMDVHPNPGWDRPICNSNIYNSVPSTEHHANFNGPANNVIRYSSCQLFSLKTKSIVPANLYNHLKECGVLKTRGVRSGKLVKQKSRNIPLLDRSRHFMSLQQCQGTCINSIIRSRKNCHVVNFNN